MVVIACVISGPAIGGSHGPAKPHRKPAASVDQRCKALVARLAEVGGTVGESAGSDDIIAELSRYPCEATFAAIEYLSSMKVDPNERIDQPGVDHNAAVAAYMARLFERLEKKNIHVLSLLATSQNRNILMAAVMTAYQISPPDREVLKQLSNNKDPLIREGAKWRLDIATARPEGSACLQANAATSSAPTPVLRQRCPARTPLPLR